MLELMKSRHSQRLSRTKNRTFDLAVEVFVRSISIVLLTKLLSHDLNAFWCVRLSSRDAKSMLNVATFLKTAVFILHFQQFKTSLLLHCSLDLSNSIASVIPHDFCECVS